MTFQARKMKFLNFKTDFRPGSVDKSLGQTENGLERGFAKRAKF